MTRNAQFRGFGWEAIAACRNLFLIAHLTPWDSVELS
jgi:hypothetical protein